MVVGPGDFTVVGSGVFHGGWVKQILFTVAVSSLVRSSRWLLRGEEFCGREFGCGYEQWSRAAVTSSQFVHGGWVRPSLFAEAEGGRSCFAVAVVGSSGLF